MIATDTVRPALANNLRTRALAANMLRPATRRPAIKATTSVLVWVRSSMIPSHGDGGQGAPPGQLATEPEHDHQPERDRGEVRDLYRGDRPELTGEPAFGESTVGGHDDAEEHRAEHYARAHFSWHLTSNRSRRSNHGESSQSTATNSPSLTVRYKVPTMWPVGWMPR